MALKDVKEYWELRKIVDRLGDEALKERINDAFPESGLEFIAAVDRVEELRKSSFLVRLVSYFYA